MENQNRKIYGLQFHPEVEHTEFGSQILRNFIEICGLKVIPENKVELGIKNLELRIKKIVGGKDYVIGAVSGGVDSTVAAILTAKAIGKKFIPIYVENGLMRKGSPETIRQLFSKLSVKPKIIDVQGEMLKRLKGVTDPEKKRKIIGRFYIEIF